MTDRVRVGVLISGKGSNLQALIDATGSRDYPAAIACVVSNVSGVEGLRRAERAGIATHVVPHTAYGSREAFDDAIDRVLGASSAALVCLAGFMRVLSDSFVLRWRGRLVNIHPSLLPGFKGLNVHRRVIEAGSRISGCSVHFVVPELDSGPIIAQAAVPVWPGDTPEALASRTLAAEHKLYPHALRLLAEGRVVLEGEQVRFRDVGRADGALYSPPL